MTGIVAQNVANIAIATTTLNYPLLDINPAPINDSGYFTAGTCSTMAFMNAGDTAKVQLVVYGSTKTVGIFGGSGDPRTTFAGYLVC